MQNAFLRLFWSFDKFKVEKVEQTPAGVVACNLNENQPDMQNIFQYLISLNPDIFLALVFAVLFSLEQFLTADCI